MRSKCPTVDPVGRGESVFPHGSGGGLRNLPIRRRFPGARTRLRTSSVDSFWWLLALALAGGSANGVAAHFEAVKHAVPKAPAPAVTFESSIVPLLSRYCYDCHGEKKKGGLDLRLYRDQASVLRDKPVFEKVLKNLQAHEMPPEKK